MLRPWQQWVHRFRLRIDRFRARYSDGHMERFPDLAAELVRLNVDVIVTSAAPAARAAKQATTTIPIVAIGMSDPVGQGLVASLARPGGNITGSATLFPELAAKRLALFKEALPKTSRVAVLKNAHQRRQDSERRKTVGLAHRTAHHLRAGHQPEDGKSAEVDDPPSSPPARGPDHTVGDDSWDWDDHGRRTSGCNGSRARDARPRPLSLDVRQTDANDEHGPSCFSNN